MWFYYTYTTLAYGAILRWISHQEPTDLVARIGASHFSAGLIRNVAETILHVRRRIGSDGSVKASGAAPVTIHKTVVAVLAKRVSWYKQIACIADEAPFLLGPPAVRVGAR